MDYFFKMFSLNLQYCRIENFFVKVCVYVNQTPGPGKRSRRRQLTLLLILDHFWFSDFWQVCLFFFNEQLKFGKTNHQHFLWKMRNSSKTKKDFTICTDKVYEKNYLTICLTNLNRFRGYQPGVQNMHSICWNFHFEKKAKFICDILLVMRLCQNIIVDVYQKVIIVL